MYNSRNEFCSIVSLPQIAVHFLLPLHYVEQVTRRGGLRPCSEACKWQRRMPEFCQSRAFADRSSGGLRAPVLPLRAPLRKAPLRDLRPTEASLELYSEGRIDDLRAGFYTLRVNGGCDRRPVSQLRESYQVNRNSTKKRATQEAKRRTDDHEEKISANHYRFSGSRVCRRPSFFPCAACIGCLCDDSAGPGKTAGATTARRAVCEAACRESACARAGCQAPRQAGRQAAA